MDIQGGRLTNIFVFHRDRNSACILSNIKITINFQVGDHPCPLTRNHRFPLEAISLAGGDGSDPGMDKRTPNKQHTHYSHDNPGPANEDHALGRFRHALLGGNITAGNLAKLAIGFGIALLGFHVGGYGIDRLSDSRRGWRGWLLGFGGLALFFILAFGGASFGLGFGFFEYWRIGLSFIL
jgi:hypothetical protein